MEDTTAEDGRNSDAVGAQQANLDGETDQVNPNLTLGGEIPLWSSFYEYILFFKENHKTSLTESFKSDVTKICPQSYPLRVLHCKVM